MLERRIVSWYPRPARSTVAVLPDRPADCAPNGIHVMIATWSVRGRGSLIRLARNLDRHRPPPNVYLVDYRYVSGIASEHAWGKLGCRGDGELIGVRDSRVLTVIPEYNDSDYDSKVDALVRLLVEA